MDFVCRNGADDGKKRYYLLQKNCILSQVRRAFLCILLAGPKLFLSAIFNFHPRIPDGAPLQGVPYFKHQCL